MLHEIDNFNSVFQQEIDDSHAFFVTPVGAYSSQKLLEEAESHLSKWSQQVINDKQKRDWQAAGTCLALDLYTASGFHAMRAVEEEARIYHKVVTGVALDDVPLGALINGSNKKGGLKPQYILEGEKSDSPLGLIVSMLAQLNKIYRCPIMHPEMTLDAESARIVFNLASIAISAIVEDGARRLQAQAQKEQAQGQTP